MEIFKPIEQTKKKNETKSVIQKTGNGKQVKWSKSLSKCRVGGNR